MQFSGFLSMLRSIAKEGKIAHGLSDEMRANILRSCANKFVRFGTYGEPSLLPFDLVENMALNAQNWTGYTHQSTKAWAQKFSAYFMASAHSESTKTEGWRNFVSIAKIDEVNGVNCPASKEMNYVSNCAKCGLCSGINGKGKRDVKIKLH